MAVTFVIGRAGSGKTHHCFTSIVEAMRKDPLGPPIFWLLPRQATFNAERELTCSSGLGGFCRTRVLSFDQFGRWVNEECGGSTIPEITPLGRQMILGLLLRKLEPRLELFGGSARRIGLAAQLDRAFTELEQSGASGEELAAIVAELGRASGDNLEAESLAAKLRDMALVYEHYHAYLGQERFDQHLRSAHVLKLLEQCASLRGAQFFVDDFPDFADVQRRMLVSIAKIAESVQICLLLDPASPILRDPKQQPDAMNLFHRTEQTYRRLFLAFQEAGVPVTPPILLRESWRFARSAALARLERCFDGKPTPPGDSAGIELIEAVDRRGEIDAVAAQIRALLSEGFRQRDIAVLARDLSTYHDHVSASFAEHGISFFVDRRRSAAHHPLLRLVRCVLEMARFDWPTDAVVDLLKTGLVEVTSEQADAIENYLLAHDLRGAGAWASERSWEKPGLPADEDSDESSAFSVPIDAARRKFVAIILPSLKRLGAAEEMPLRHIAAEIFTLIENLGVRARLEQWITAARAASQIEQAEEHEQVWAELTGLFQQMVDLLGDEPMSLQRFSDVLESGLESFDLALTPPMVDQVLVGQVDRTRSPRLRAVFVVGLCEGGFPAVPGDAPVLSDRERRELAKIRPDLATDSRRRLLDERLLGYVALTRSNDRLYLSRPLADDGHRPVGPSVFWQRVALLIPDAPIRRRRPGATLAPQDIITPRQLIGGLMRNKHEPDGDEANRHLWGALEHWLLRRPAAADALSRLRDRAWSALAFENKAELQRETRGGLFPAPLTASIGQLESFAACPYQHFARFGLHLEPRRRQVFGAYESSRLSRRLLDRLMDRAMRANPQWEGDDFPIGDTEIDDALRTIDDDLGDALESIGARGRYLLGRARRMLGLFLAAQREVMKRNHFRPAFVAVAFGRGGRMGPLQISTPKGSSVAVHGRIDRVDLAQDGNAFCAIDYRYQSEGLSMDQLRHGISLRLLTEILALLDNGQTLAERKLHAAGGLAVSLFRRIEDIEHPDEAPDPTDPAFCLAVKPRGIFPADRLLQFDRGLTEGWSQVVQAYVKKDGSLGNRHNCDVADEVEFGSILLHVREKLGELAEQIMSGDISIKPYRLNEQSPCARCDMRSVCRFQPRYDSYRHLETLGRLGAIAKMGGSGGR
jgi:ATP-dependent helicase/nuclease subunit B